MSHQKDTVRAFYEAILNQSDKSVIPQLTTEDFVMRGSLGLVHQRGHGGLAVYMDFIRASLGNYHCEILDMVEESNKVCARMCYSGTHQGELFGYAPTHGKIRWDGVAIFTFAEDRIAEVWALGDVDAVIKQLAKYLG